MIYLFYVFSLITAWSIAVVSDQFKRYEYDKYWMIIWYSYVISLSFYLNDQIFSTISSFVFYVLTLMSLRRFSLSVGKRVC